MSRKKVLIVAAALIAGGAAIAVSAPGQRLHDRMMDRWSHSGGHGTGMTGFMGLGRGDITRAQFDEKMRERFARFDQNSDGVVDAAELEAALAKGGRQHHGWRDRRAERDGASSREGAGKGEAQPGHGMSKSEFLDEVRRRFAFADLDNDGRITDADLPPPMRGRDVLARLADGQGQHMRGQHQGRGFGGAGLGFLSGANVDKDGAIALAEAVRVAGERFDRMDRNKDGTLNRADRQAFAKEMTDYRLKRVLHRFGATDGKISRDQAFKVAGEVFDRMDRNKDGTISRDERPGGWRRSHDGQHHWRGRDRGEERAPDRGPDRGTEEPKKI